MKRWQESVLGFVAGLLALATMIWIVLLFAVVFGSVSDPVAIWYVKLYGLAFSIFIAFAFSSYLYEPHLHINDETPGEKISQIVEKEKLKYRMADERGKLKLVRKWIGISQKKYGDKVLETALTVLYEFGSEACIGHLMDMLERSPHKGLRWHSMDLLSQLGRADVLESLRRILRGDADEDLRYHAAATLGKLKDEPSLNNILELFTQIRKWKRELVAVVGQLGGEGATHALTGLLTDKTLPRDIRTAAAQELASVRTEEVTVAVMEYLDDILNLLLQALASGSKQREEVLEEDYRCVLRVLGKLDGAGRDLYEKKLGDEKRQCLRLREAETRKCMVCGKELRFNRMIGGEELVGMISGKDPGLEAAAYRCRKCGSMMCMGCATHQRCKKCGSNTFDHAWA
jgi:hypothetical protein